MRSLLRSVWLVLGLSAPLSAQEGILGTFSARAPGPDTLPADFWMAPELLQVVIGTYQLNPETEQAYCLFGQVSKTAVLVTGLVADDSALPTRHDVTASRGCAGAFPGVPTGAGPGRYLGLLHTHQASIPNAEPNIPIIYLRPDQIGVACSHYLVLNSGEVSHIAGADLVAFGHDPTGLLSAIFCGDRLVWVTREGVERTLYVRRLGGP